MNVAELRTLLPLEAAVIPVLTIFSRPHVLVTSKAWSHPALSLKNLNMASIGSLNILRVRTNLNFFSVHMCPIQAAFNCVVARLLAEEVFSSACIPVTTPCPLAQPGGTATVIYMLVGRPVRLHMCLSCGDKRVHT